MEKPIQIPVGNACELRIRPILQDGSAVAPAVLSNIKVTLTTNHTSADYAHSIDTQYICVALPATMKAGEYDVHITAELSDRAVAMHRKSLISRTLFDNGMSLESYKSDFIIIGSSDDDLEDLKEALADAIVEYNDATAEMEAKTAALNTALAGITDMAKETTSQSILTKVAELYAYCATRFDGIITTILPPLEVKLNEINAYLANRFAWVGEQFGNLTTYITNVKSVADGIKTDIANHETADSNRNITTQNLINTQAQTLARQMDVVDGKVGDYEVTAIIVGELEYGEKTQEMTSAGTKMWYWWHWNEEHTARTALLTTSRNPQVGERAMTDNGTKVVFYAYISGLKFDSVKNDLAAISQELGKLGTPKSGAEYTTLFGAIEANAGGGGDDTAVQLFADKFRAAGISVPQDATLYDLYQRVVDFLCVSYEDGILIETEDPINICDLWVLGGQYFKVLKSSVFTGSLNLYNNKVITEIHISSSCNFPLQALCGCSNLKILDTPNANSFGRQFARSCSSLRKINMLSCANSFSEYELADCPNLIDITIGKNINSNISFPTAQYRPYNAYSNTSSSLIEEGETFNNNREKWNWCLREHFAANLTDRNAIVDGGGTAYTITFGSTILAAMEQATIDAFTNKGWALA